MALRIFVLALAIVLLMPSVTIAQTSVPGGFVSGTWTLSGSPYLVQGSVQIPDGSTLIIEPGVSVIFQGGYKMLVMGRLLAVGTPTDSISFTASDTSVGWRGIRFDNTPSTNDSSIISYCKIIKSKSIAPPDDNGGGIYINNVYNLRISNSLIYQCSADFSGGGIWCGSSDGNPHVGPFIINNIIKENSCSPGGVCYNEGGGGIFSNYSATPVIKGNQILDNSALGYCAFGGGIMAHNFIIIEENIISRNYSDADGGGMRVGSGNWVRNNIISYNSCLGNGGGIAGAASFRGNVISNNSAVLGGGIYWGSNIINISAFSDNIICNNSSNEGGGIYVFNGVSSTLTNNTIVNNSADKGGAIYAKDNSDLILRNCIIYGNEAITAGSQVFLFDDASDPELSFCDLQGGSSDINTNGNFYTGVYQNNINIDPNFVNPSIGVGVGFDGVNADWSLQSNSPCIDAGDPDFISNSTDFAGNNRVTVCRVDIGAFEYQTGIPFQASLSVEHPVSCFGYSDAVLQASASGSGAPYSYAWSNGDTTAVTDSLSIGFYSVTISNATGCERIDTITLTQPNGMYFTPYTTPGTCSGICDGSVNVHVWWGGTPPYTYLWNTPLPDTTAVTSSTLCPGYYSVTITDSLGCHDTTGILLEAPSGLSLNVNVTEVICHGDHNGGFYLNATGGTGTTYQYTINGGSMWTYSSTFSNLAPGTYTILAKDMSGCMTQPQDIVLADPPLLETAIIVSEASCYNGNNGSVNISVSGGVPSYFISWNIPGQPQYFPYTSPVLANNVPVGNYIISLIDSRSCSDTLPFTVGVSLDSPYVCIVTVDTLSWKNAVIWEKPLTAGITEFRIYKEISVNNYSQIGTVPYSSNPRFVDIASVPESHGDKYKITAVDTCGDESVLSPFHKTMNLTIAAFGSTMGLNWDDYVDESSSFVPPTYYIYRGTSLATMTMLDSVSGSFNSYNDLNVYSLYYYMVGVKKTDGCNNAKSAIVSFSNKKDNSGMGIGDNNMQAGTILISPNPMNTSATFEIPNFSNQFSVISNKLTITDITGKVVREISLSEADNFQISSSSNLQIKIKRGDLKPGIYFIEFVSNRTYRGKLIVE